jgi:hypothetical protein
MAQAARRTTSARESGPRSPPLGGVPDTRAGLLRFANRYSGSGGDIAERRSEVDWRAIATRLL